MVVLYMGSFKQHFKETGPHPSPRLTNCSWSFSYFSCNKPLCESTRDVFEKQTQETVKTVLKLKTCPDNPAYTVFLNHQTLNFSKNPARLHLMAFEFYHCLRIQRLTWIRLMKPQCQILLPGVNLNLRSVCL